MKSTEDALRDKEMEMEILKNQLRDQKTECQHLRESMQSLQSSTSNSNSGEVEQKVFFIVFIHLFFCNKILLSLFNVVRIKKIINFKKIICVIYSTSVHYIVLFFIVRYAL